MDSEREAGTKGELFPGEAAFSASERIEEISSRRCASSSEEDSIVEASGPGTSLGMRTSLRVFPSFFPPTTAAMPSLMSVT